MYSPYPDEPSPGLELSLFVDICDECGYLIYLDDKMEPYFHVCPHVTVTIGYELDEWWRYI